jgi:hypothetical protein
MVYSGNNDHTFQCTNQCTLAAKGYQKAMLWPIYKQSTSLTTQTDKIKIWPLNMYESEMETMGVVWNYCTD